MLHGAVECGQGEHFLSGSKGQPAQHTCGSSRCALEFMFQSNLALRFSFSLY